MRRVCCLWSCSVWREGGDSRAGLHAAGGALIGGLGGGSGYGAIGGAVAAGLASKLASSLNDISKGVASATGSDLIGNLAANIAAGLGGAAVGGTAGASMASNVHLYNQSMDDERQLTGDIGRKSPSLFDLAMQGIANGLNAIIGMSGGVPPAASTGAVLVSGAGQALAAGTASSGSIIAGNTTFNSGNGEGQSASGQSGNSSDGKSTVVVDNARAGHIFRDSEGHLSDTPANRALLEQVANNPNAVAGTDKYGTVWSSSIQSDGTQVWVGVRDGKVSYGGVNQIPKEFNSQTGFSSPTKRGGTK